MVRFVLLSFQASLAVASKPHIIHIVADDLGFHDVGFRNDKLINTPHIDHFAEDGLVLDQYYVQSVCSPTRAAMMTGRYPLHNTVVDWLKTGTAMALPLNETLIPQALAKAGYKSHMTGKWHLGLTTWQHTPTFRGFDSYVGFYTGGEDYFKHTAGSQYDFRRDMQPNCGAGCSQVAFSGDSGRYSAEVFAEEAVRLITEHDADAAPLFLYLAFQSVHSPRQVPESYVEPYADTIKDKVRRNFAGMVSCMDEGIGNVTRALKSKGMLDNSLIIFSSDNGGPTPDTPGGDYAGASNFPLRGGKHSIWEGGTRVTGAVWAGKSTGLISDERRGTVAHQLMHGVDWMPTYCSVAGIPEVCDGLPLDGVDQSGPLFQGSQAVRTEIFYGQHDDAPNSYQPYDTALRDGDGWKLFQGSGGKPDTWSQPVNSSLNTPLAQCGMKESGTCYPNNDLDHLMDQTEDQCCTACASNEKCVGYTFRMSTGDCYIKAKLGAATHDSDCSSAPRSDGPSPTPAPSPAPEPSGPVMLFNVLTDPEERNEVSSQYPEIVQRLSARIDELRATKVEVIGGGTHADHSCPAYNKKDHTDPQAGQIVEPWCDHELAVLA